MRKRSRYARIDVNRKWKCSTLDKQLMNGMTGMFTSASSRTFPTPVSTYHLLVEDEKKCSKSDVLKIYSLFFWPSEKKNKKMESHEVSAPGSGASLHPNGSHSLRWSSKCANFYHSSSPSSSSSLWCYHPHKWPSSSMHLLNHLSRKNSKCSKLITISWPSFA